MTQGNETKLQKCEEMSRFYHSKFDDVPTLSSETYLHEKEKYILVDVRSAAEQKVSMIPNAISLKHFESNMKKKQDNMTDSDDDNNFESRIVVTYCTIGYRSGLEGRRLRDEYNLHGKIMNLDGIVCYTHACSKEVSTMNAYTKESQSFLMDPKNKTSTMKVHVFGTSWDYAADRFETTYFSKAVMAWKGLGVGLKSCFHACCFCKKWFV